jgi:hypothetical protein
MAGRNENFFKVILKRIFIKTSLIGIISRRNAGMEMAVLKF